MKRKIIGNNIKKILRFIALFLFLLVAVAPLYWIIITSLKGPKEIYSNPIKYFPSHITFASYKKLFSFSNFGRYFFNSILLSISAAFGALVLSLFSGFALSRYKYRHERDNIILAFYFTQMIPGFIIMTPLYTMMAKIGMTDNLVVMGIIYIATSVAFSSIMAKSFFDNVPSALEEAALIDGCNTIQAIFHVIIPVMLPGLSAIFSFSFVNIWNELFLAVMFLSSDTKMTVPVALNSFVSKAGISWDIMSAGIVIALLPTMIVFGFTQKYIVAGLTEGSVKG
jgi:multiple sugar transport system permease protein